MLGEFCQLLVVERLIAMGRLKKRETILIVIHRPSALNVLCQNRVLCGSQDACLARYVRALFETSTLADLAGSVDAEASSVQTLLAKVSLSAVLVDRVSSRRKVRTHRRRKLLGHF